MLLMRINDGRAGCDKLETYWRRDVMTEGGGWARPPLGGAVVNWKEGARPTGEKQGRRRDGLPPTVCLRWWRRVSRFAIP